MRLDGHSSARRPPRYLLPPIPHGYQNLGPGRLDSLDIHLSPEWIQFDLATGWGEGEAVMLSRSKV